MTNLTIEFTNSPWLLFVLIPAIVVALIPYFRLNKKYRRTRNRISSLSLHITIMILATLVLAGLKFNYEIPKEGNEMIILVDVSKSQELSDADETDYSEASSELRDRFVKTALYLCVDAGMSVGVVTFGFDQNYCVPFTKNATEAYNAYVTAALPDQSATDIASALDYARTLFNNPDTAKIILVTDGKETDGNAKAAIRNVLAQNTKVDFVDVRSYYKHTDTQVVDVVYPDYHVKLNEECEIKAVLSSNMETGSANVTFRDNGEFVTTIPAELYNGNLEVTFKHKFKTDGLHEITFSVEADATSDDSIAENNIYTSFYDLRNFNKILVLEGVSNQSENLKALLETDDLYDVTVKNLYTDTEINGFTVNDLREYDQIILNNVSNYDLCPYSPYYNDTAHAALEKSNAPDGFDEMLYEYVSVFGGGILTVGGSEAGDQGTAHAYNRKDMSNTLYQKMLPVQAINYTPPLGVVIIIDVSGSMSAGAEDGYNRLHWAKIGADVCLSALSERDYVGVMTLFDQGGVNNEVILPMTARTQEAKIREAIYSIDDGDTKGSTVYSGAIDRACQMLNSINVEKKHVILVTDGVPNSGDVEVYEQMVRSYYLNDGTTFSVFGIAVGDDSSAANTIERLAALCTDDNGVQTGRVYYSDRENASRLGQQMKEDLNASDLKEVNYETYCPVINNVLSPLVQNLDKLEGSNLKIDTTLEGYYGVKVRDQADLVLTGNFEVPLYAQWKVGGGMVGSFMCDLNKVWSAQFMEDAVGQKFIVNVIENLMPVESIRPVELNVRIVEDNYTNTINVFDVLNEGEKIVGTVTDVTGSGGTVSLNEKVSDDLTVEERASLGFYVRKNLSADNNYSVCEYVIKKSGVYLVTLDKVDADGNILATYSFYKSFAYSKEYDIMLGTTEVDGTANIEELAAGSRGNVITDPDNPTEIFRDFVLTLAASYDPRYLFMILAIILFLLDIIVRKFKFKWPHEWFKKRDDKFKK